MSLSYKSVQWNAHKRVYDLLIAASIVAYIGCFFAISALSESHPRRVSEPVLLIRATATCAYLMLHLILAIGPLCRLDRRFLPLLYNRRHLGVAMFGVSLVHAGIAIGFYHGFGVTSPFVSLLSSNTEYRSTSAFPFEILGVLALLILFLMAATSHDFWLKNLSPRVWKSLHMGVYAAYALLVGHVVLGALQSERSLAYPILVMLGATLICGLHIVAGQKERRRDRASRSTEWIDVAPLDDIIADVGTTVCGHGERIAIYRRGDRLSAMSNVCAHQGGPVGEGRVVNGCVTCPWHGYQYQPNDASSPPPFTEKLRTYPLRISAGRVMVHPKALPPGTDASILISTERQHES